MIFLQYNINLYLLIYSIYNKCVFIYLAKKKNCNARAWSVIIKTHILNHHLDMTYVAICSMTDFEKKLFPSGIHKQHLPFFLRS